MQRWLLTGLVAGVVILVVGAGLIPILGDEMDRALARFQLPPMPPASMVFFACASMTNGIGLVGLYALVSTLFTSRAKAVLTTTLAYWVIAYFLPNASLVAYGFMSVGLSMKGAAWGILELGLACAVAARMYKAPNDQE